MRQLLKSTYIPFGTQYYRAPSPYRDQWEHDLARIAELGLNTVKFWVQWRWNNPAEGEFYFDDIDRLMELAHKNGLRVMLNTIVDVAPAWLYQKYPDLSMITLDGRAIGPQVQPHRQIGGLGACFNHAAAMEYMFTFLRATVKRYADHPALEIWNVGSEPELTSSMAEMRVYADNAEKMGDMLCYCDNCRRAFIGWLGKKYGDIEHLNIAWNRNYRSFDAIELPKTRNSFNDVIDWRMFFVHTLGENVKRRFTVAREEDQGKHPLMCHHVFVQGFPVTSTASDPWNVGQYGDLHAITQMDDPMMCDVLRSCARGKPVISAEMLMLFGYTLDLPKAVGVNDVKRNIFTGLAADLKGFIFWQYRPEILAREAPAWGLTRLDGSTTPWLETFADVNRVLQKNADLVLDAHPRPADVAILYNPENQIFGWAATGNEKNVTDSLLGTHQALYQRNFNVDFIHPRELVAVIDQYRVVYVPFPYVLSEEICRKLESWVEAGGVLIGESYFAGWNTELGRHQTTIPGYGLHKVFKVRQANAIQPDERGVVEFEITRDLPFARQGRRVVGSMARETFFIEGADVLGQYLNGEPAVTSAAYGKGKAMLVGSYIGMPLYRSGHQGNADLIASLVAVAGGPPRAHVLSDGRVRLDQLTDARGNALLIVRNLESQPLEVEAFFPFSGKSTATEQFSGETIELKQSENGVRTRFRLLAGEVKVYRA